MEPQPRSTRRIEQFLLPDGTEIWLLERRLYHRPDGPAVIHPDGRTEWWWLGALQGQGPTQPFDLRDEHIPFSTRPVPMAASGGGGQDGAAGVPT